MCPPQVTQSSWGHLAQGIMSVEGTGYKASCHIQKLFMTGFEPPMPKVINQGRNICVKNLLQDHCCIGATN
ncbi:hypothetical protein DVA76_19565, partial [Acinetobacter baumannii]